MSLLVTNENVLIIYKTNRVKTDEYDRQYIYRQFDRSLVNGHLCKFTLLLK